MTKKITIRASALAALAFGVALPGVDRTIGLRRLRATPKTKIKLCLYCGQPHTHHNSFCSPEHCTAWREMKKKQKS